MDTVTANLLRAQSAIARARALSTQLSTLCLQSPESDTSVDSAAPSASGAGSTEGPSPAPRSWRLNAETEAHVSALEAARNHSEAEALASDRFSARPLTAAAREPCSPSAASPAGVSSSEARGERPDPRPPLDEAETERGCVRSSSQSGVSGLATAPDSSGAGPGAEPGPEEAACSPADDPRTELSALSSLSGPVLAVAQQLAALQRKQSETLQQLMVLRMQQLKLRQQQLLALQELLAAEAAAIEGTPLQVAAVEQAVGLLGSSLGDMKAASRAMLLSRPEDVQAISAAVSATDLRADEVSRMARQLLGVLRAFPRRDARLRDQDTVPGATPEAIAALPTTACEAGSPLLNGTCCICLGAFAEGDQLKSLQCIHYHHAACLDEWLRIRACCPLCKIVLAPS
ncbi:hypothetical protein HYH03_004591 [Edaphochlamys debaryana]|uniref:RING-type domain-containing protein n=1 Tax=Edaphochlamys debaryana TaxID=47281 RepID=A0A835YAV5_9CHLO|nr:hypothetical protein HYH03_004591 [Edaphochlamys debaryana]|eukprot:KAG2497436.1 hypothetical protein HYH03_004591 [Edaphochlamys debaryana]